MLGGSSRSGNDYNVVRLHSSLDGLTPSEYER